MRGISSIFAVLFLVSATVIGTACKRSTKTTHTEHTSEKAQYTCPMHPQIVRDAPGKCPICGMDLVRKETKSKTLTDIKLTTLLLPTDEYVVSTVPVTFIQYRHEPMEIEAVGYTAYNTSSIGVISSRVAGRIERLYIKSRFQYVSKGQRIMDIYSPELATAQENLLYVLRNDASNHTLINSAKQRLLLLGMSEGQVHNVIANRNALFAVAVYSNYNGHIHETPVETQGMQAPTVTSTMSEVNSQTTEELSLKEGMYVEKGKPMFSVYDPSNLWGILNIYQEDQPYVRVGNSVRIVPESNPENDFRTTVRYVEPVFREGSRTITARVNISNIEHKIPVGSQLQATIFTPAHSGWWLPKESVFSLGINKVVFVKRGLAFAVQKVITGHEHPNWIQIIEGVGVKDSIAANAQYLMDSESFIKDDDEQN